MRTNEEILESNFNEMSADSFDWDEAVSMTLDIVRWAVQRKDYENAAKHCIVLGFLGIELEDLELSDADLNNVGRCL